jgi:predicted metal-dependent peptidase
MAKKSADQTSPDQRRFLEGVAMANGHPLLEALFHHMAVSRNKNGNHCPPTHWFLVNSSGHVDLNPFKDAEPEEWFYVIARACLSLALDHVRNRTHSAAWAQACAVDAARLQKDLKLGVPPTSFELLSQWPRSVENLYEYFCEHPQSPEQMKALVLTEAGLSPLVVLDKSELQSRWWRLSVLPVWPDLFAKGIARAVEAAVDHLAPSAVTTGEYTPVQRARRWFIDHFPLLGALASGFRIIDDIAVCQRMEIQVAAVNDSLGEIYVNRSCGLDEEQWKFVLAHEFLHAGLQHQARRKGRDPFLWNVACDFVINDWLIEMHVGRVPALGLLYDPTLKSESADSIYDRMAKDLRRYRKLATFRASGLGDMLGPGSVDRERRDLGRDQSTLEDFYRRALRQGLEYHRDSGRGRIPGGLEEEILTLDQPPIPWDVRLAWWFDEQFPPLEERRTYARASRRQSSTPDIPRPGKLIREEDRLSRTFAVVVDTSGSMDRELLGKALGAIAAYGTERAVRAVRVVFCDAEAHDQGWMECAEIAGRMVVKGRGGTVLQPAVDLLEHSTDFPRNGPILIITDGYCDVLTLAREHAFLLPEGHGLPFRPWGPVFELA